MKRALFIFSIILAGAALAAPAFAYVSPGKPSGFVNDFAGILSAGEKSSLESRLSAYEKETGNEIVVVTTPSISGETIETYATALFEEWGIGKEREDNGALLLVAPNEREVRIEVGYGLEPYLTDAASSVIIRDTIIPAFREGKYGEGMVLGTERMLGVLTGAETITDERMREDSVADFSQFFGVLVIILVQLVPVIIYSKSWWLGGVVGLVLGFVMFQSLVGAGILAVIGLVLDFVLSKKFGGKMPPGRSGGVWFGGLGGRNRGGGFGGFGGGLSGGGGSSGRW